MQKIVSNSSSREINKMNSTDLTHAQLVFNAPQRPSQRFKEQSGPYTPEPSLKDVFQTCPCFGPDSAGARRREAMREPRREARRAAMRERFSGLIGFLSSLKRCCFPERRKRGANADATYPERLLVGGSYPE